MLIAGEKRISLDIIRRGEKGSAVPLAAFLTLIAASRIFTGMNSGARTRAYSQLELY